MDNNDFYLGRLVDTHSREVTDTPLLYDPDDLVTHGVVVGMTGSGKTGLCLSLLEEAALNNIPALMIDPKGDITNALLHFPDLAPADFQPWINPSEARREEKTVAEMAEATAVAWREGLAKWDIQPQRLQQLQDSAQFAIYTPGSDAGLSLSILASLAAPDLDWNSHRELLREKISGTVTALLGLIGLKNIDPVRSREHILLANIFEQAWQQGQDLDLATLIMQTQTPPFEKLGVFDVETFFSEKDRFELAMLLNNILAAPAFQPWIKGEPLDIATLLFDANGRARHNVFYIAHLSETERMFFVTLLYSAIESWMRTQSGSTSLRLLVYFDEIYGYLPPVENPPSKEPMLRMLKQARAFGVGMLLATQNPADIDYKALSNAGTWFIGKLATERDKLRLLDGLQTVAEDGLNRSEYEDLISELGKRIFLLRNVHESQPQSFHTRWAMNYLAGPMTRDQIPALNALVGATAVATSEPIALPAKPLTDLPPTMENRPALPRGIAEYFLPPTLTVEEAITNDGRFLPETMTQPVGLIYRPYLLAHARVTIRNRKYSFDKLLTHTVLTEAHDPLGLIRWQDETEPLDPKMVTAVAITPAQYEPLEQPLNDAATMRRMKNNFIDWLYQHKSVPILANEKLKMYAPPNTTEDDFRQSCWEAVRTKFEDETAKTIARHDREIETLRRKLAREQQEMTDDEADLAYRKRKEITTHAKTAFSFWKKGRIDQSLDKRRATQKAEAEVQESIDAIAAMQQELGRREEEKALALTEVHNKWMATAETITTIEVTPFKKDIMLVYFGVAWLPYHLIQTDTEIVSLPAYTNQASK